MKTKTLKLLVFGGRNYADRGMVYSYLDHWHPEIIVHGDCQGADRLAKDWAIANEKSQLTYPANWNKYGRSAGPIRNQQMLDAHPDISWAIGFVSSPIGPGSHDMYSRCKKAGVEVYLVVEGAPIPEPHTQKEFLRC